MTRYLRPGIRRGASRVLPSSWGTTIVRLHMFPSDAGRTACTRPLRCCSWPLNAQVQRLPRWGLSTLNSMAFGLAVYASQCGLLSHHARLASSCWSGSTGRAFHPHGSAERFQSCRFTSHPVRSPKSCPGAPIMGLWDEAESFEDLSRSRKKWPATWFEEDWGLAQLQLDIGRIWSDAHAALKKGGHGLIAKHWRHADPQPQRRRNARPDLGLRHDVGTSQTHLARAQEQLVERLLQAVGDHPVWPRGGGRSRGDLRFTRQVRDQPARPRHVAGHSRGPQGAHAFTRR